MNLTPEHTTWLRERGISDDTLALFELRSFINKIIIPIKDKDGNILFNKYRRDPSKTEGPKYTYDAGARVALFNSERLSSCASIIICEGELDVLRLDSFGLTAVTSTGGALTFPKEWVSLFDDKEVFICMDNDDAGEKGAMKISSMIPHAKIIPLPPDIGLHGDITDYFKKYTIDNFKSLMKNAYTPDHPPQTKETQPRKIRKKQDGTRIEQAKSVPIENLFVGKLSRRGNLLVGLCPFHNETTPSFVIYTENNTWFCFAGCGGRDPIDFVKKRDNLTFNEALEILCKE